MAGECLLSLVAVSGSGALFVMRGVAVLEVRDPCRRRQLARRAHEPPSRSAAIPLGSSFTGSGCVVSVFRATSTSVYEGERLLLVIDGLDDDRTTTAD